MKKEEFEEKAHAFHGCMYDYSNLPSEFSTKSKVEIVCRVHGSFWQKAGNHIYGRHTGCPICGKEQSRQKTYKHYVGDIIHGVYGDYEIIERIPVKKVKVKFLNTGTVVIDTIGNALKGQIKDYAKPIIFGIGFIGERSNKNTKITKNKAYIAWSNMLKRCYDKESLKNHPTYEDCEVCEEWRCFKTFEEWYNKNIIEGFFLDKDILFKGNKLYSPQTCCFVPNEINCLFTKRQNFRGKLPIGVLFTESKMRYKSYLTKGNERLYLGCYSTPEEAFQAYKKAKEAWIKEVANKWKDKLAPNVYEALMKYEVEITD